MWILLFILLFPVLSHAAEVEPVKETALVKSNRAEATMGPEIEIAKDATGRKCIQLDIDKADAEDPNFEAHLELWVRGPIFYEPRYAIGWRGNTPGRDGITIVPGEFCFNSAKFAGKKLRVRVVPVKSSAIDGQSANIGATIEK